ncbi:hypothetical protein [Rhodopirellula sp. MGV]|uniref:hypothetical protein n=1 Tax=Rhodopirellula sp. MGV TaxID=2023130 RepID=UPI000B95D9F2|nr:hypothetical protein [Rhodopirellula sp. MGV]OYP28482.1 hypothetical protein CGZ80_27160 [Rhodopirellula sp. MGV]PNY38640.1 hypothetical protein C2E31_01610 [Rhodopirellula baltica]
MDLTVNQARDHLEAQLAPLDTKAAELESVLAGINENRKRLRAALTALDGGTGKSRNKPARKCVTKDMVIEIADQLVADNTQLPKADLDALIRSKVQGKGFSLSGFALRFNEAMNCGRFTVSDSDVVSLRASEPRAQAG